MHRIDVPSATVDHKFTDGSPTGGIPATTVPADWLNDLQENLCYAIEQAGLTVTKGRSADLFDAINLLAAASGSPVISQLLAPTGFIKFKGGLIIQWGNQVVGPNTTVTSLFPTAFTTEGYQVVASYGVPSTGTAGADPLSATQYRLQNLYTVAQNIRWFATGK